VTGELYRLDVVGGKSWGGSANCLSFNVGKRKVGAPVTWDIPFGEGGKRGRRGGKDCGNTKTDCAPRRAVFVGGVRVQKRRLFNGKRGRDSGGLHRTMKT